jgi:hypothetical protein
MPLKINQSKSSLLELVLYIYIYQATDVYTSATYAVNINSFELYKLMIYMRFSISQSNSSAHACTSGYTCFSVSIYRWLYNIPML